MAFFSELTHKLGQAIGHGGEEAQGEQPKESWAMKPGPVPPVATGGGGHARTASEQAYGSEPDAVAHARTLLHSVESDPAQLLPMIHHVLDAAHRADRQVAAQLLAVLRPYGATYPAVARALDDAATVVAHTAATSHGATSAAAVATSTPTPVITGYDWTTLLVKGKGGYAAPASIAPADRAQLHAIVAGRASHLPAKRKKLVWDNEPTKGYKGWYYGGNAIAANAPTQADSLHELAVEELIRDKDSKEGSLNAIDTYDGPDNVAVGSGWTNIGAKGAAADYLRRFGAADPAARAELLAVGLAVTPDNQFAVIDNTGNLLVGVDANHFLKDAANGLLLEYLANLIEEPAHAQSAMDAQIQMVKSYRIDTLAPGLATAMKTTWDKDAVRVAIHLANWWPGAGPEQNPKDYTASGGKPLGILHAFAKNHSGFVKKKNGAYILGSNGFTGSPIDNFRRWGHHYLLDAATTGTEEHISFHDAGDPSRSDLGGCVLVAQAGVAPGQAGPVKLINTGKLVV